MMVERPQVAETRTSYVYRPGTQTVPFFVGPRVLNRPHSITADAEIEDGEAEGVLLCQGTAVGGWTFYVQHNRLHYAHNYVRRAIYRVSSPDPLPSGRHELRFEFEPTGPPDIPSGKGAPGRAQLYVDGTLVADADFPVTIPVAINPGGLTCGADPGSPVVPDYKAPFRFSGKLHTVTIDLSGDLIRDSESEMLAVMGRQ
jgi:arylsulfatase